MVSLNGFRSESERTERNLDGHPRKKVDGSREFLQGRQKTAFSSPDIGLGREARAGAGLPPIDELLGAA